MISESFLKSITFGERIAEDETQSLEKYFVKTQHWDRVFNWDVDIIYWTKGSGKSAIYSSLQKKDGELFDKKILLTAAENPRWWTVFEWLSVDPPTTEIEFTRIWKLYFIVITFTQLREWWINWKRYDELESILQESHLIPTSSRLQSILSACRGYIKSLMHVESIQWGIELNEVTWLPSGASLKISFHEPSKTEFAAGIKSIDYLYELLNSILSDLSITLWIAIDRLDVAFTEHEDLEKNALKALFKVYRDLSPYDSIKIKIFLRDDIWKRITNEWFREASHITKTLTINWSKEWVLNLIVSRIVNNDELLEIYNIKKEVVMSNYHLQEELFYKLFPQQVDAWTKKSDTLEWIINHTKDWNEIIAPREVIHLLNEAKEEQLRKFQIWKPELEEDNIISRSALKAALDTVSKVRLEQTIYAEYPTLKPYIQKLDKQKTEQTLISLRGIWGLEEKETEDIIKRLIEIWFFKDKWTTYWVPHIYRNWLNMIQWQS